VAPPTKKAAVQREWEIAPVDQLISMPNTFGLPEHLAGFFKNLLRPTEEVEPIASGFQSPPASPVAYIPGSPGDERQEDERYDIDDVAQVPYMEEEKSVEGARREPEASASSISEFISEIQETQDESFFSLATRHIKKRSAVCSPLIQTRVSICSLLIATLKYLGTAKR